MSRRRVDPVASAAKSESSSGGRRARRAKPSSAVELAPSGVMSHSDRRGLALAVAATITAGIFHQAKGNEAIAFVFTALAIAALTSLVGNSIEALGDRLGPEKTGLLQSFFGNIPLFFVLIFAVRDGLYEVAKAAVVGSVLANVLLITGIGFIVGGRKHGSQALNGYLHRQLMFLTVLSVFIISIPTAASSLHLPAAEEIHKLTFIVAILLFALFALSVLDNIRHRNTRSPMLSSREAYEAKTRAEAHGHWPLKLAVAMVGFSMAASIAVSYWFIDVLPAATTSLNMSSAFAGFVIVALASNAVENAIGIRLAANNEPDFALQVVLQSPVQVIMTITPLLALIAPLIGANAFTLVLSPMMVTALVASVIVLIVVVTDGESTWFKGAAMVALYLALATSFWWG
jgi:Ca2+:H+ antiporter